MILILSAMRAYAIVTGEDPEPQLLDFNHNDNYDDWKSKEVQAESMMRLSCSPEVQHIVKGIGNPHEMWNTLETSLDTAGSYIGRQDILPQFSACRPKEDEPLKAYFTKLSSYRIQLQPDVSEIYHECNTNWIIPTMQSPIEISARQY